MEPDTALFNEPVLLETRLEFFKSPMICIQSSRKKDWFRFKNSFLP
jgi:hypothetical protein